MNIETELPDLLQSLGINTASLDDIIQNIEQLHVIPAPSADDYLHTICPKKPCKGRLSYQPLSVTQVPPQLTCQTNPATTFNYAPIAIQLDEFLSIMRAHRPQPWPQKDLALRLSNSFSSLKKTIILNGLPPILNDHTATNKANHTLLHDDPLWREYLLRIQEREPNRHPVYTPQLFNTNPSSFYSSDATNPTTSYQHLGSLTTAPEITLRAVVWKTLIIVPIYLQQLYYGLLMFDSNVLLQCPFDPNIHHTAIFGPDDDDICQPQPKPQSSVLLINHSVFSKHADIIVSPQSAQSVLISPQDHHRIDFSTLQFAGSTAGHTTVHDDTKETSRNTAPQFESYNASFTQSSDIVCFDDDYGAVITSDAISLSKTPTMTSSSPFDTDTMSFHSISRITQPPSSECIVNDGLSSTYKPSSHPQGRRQTLSLQYLTTLQYRALLALCQYHHSERDLETLSNTALREKKVKYIQQFAPHWAVIRNDSFRTFARSKQYLAKVPEQALVRVLTAFEVLYTPNWKYCQGMNTFCGLFLFILPELDAFNALTTLFTYHIPYYWKSAHIGVAAACYLVDFIIAMIDPELSYHLLTISYPPLPTQISSFAAVSSWSSGVVQSVDNAVKLFDFQLLFGPLFSPLCVVAQIILSREKLLNTNKPNAILNYREWPQFDVSLIIANALAIFYILIRQKHTKDLLLKLQYHATNPIIISELAGRSPYKGTASTTKRF